MRQNEQWIAKEFEFLAPDDRKKEEFKLIALHQKLKAKQKRNIKAGKEDRDLERLLREYEHLPKFISFDATLLVKVDEVRLGKTQRVGLELSNFSVEACAILKDTFMLSPYTDPILELNKNDIIKYQAALISENSFNGKKFGKEISSFTTVLQVIDLYKDRNPEVLLILHFPEEDN